MSVQTLASAGAPQRSAHQWTRASSARSRCWPLRQGVKEESGSQTHLAPESASPAALTNERLAGPRWGGGGHPCRTPSIAFRHLPPVVNQCLEFDKDANWFTTSFLWRKVPESDARSVHPCIHNMHGLLMKCCFTSTETVGLLGTGAQDGHRDFLAAPELCISCSHLCP